MENTAVKSPAQKKVNLSLKQYGMVLALIAVYLIFAVITGGKNLAPMTVNNIIMQNGYVIILAVGMLLCVLTGNVDLGVGSVVATCGAVAGTLIVDFGVSSPVAMLAMPEPVPFQEVLDGIVRRVVLEVVDKVLAEPVPEPETPFEEILDDVVRDVVSKVVEQVLAEPIPEPEAEPEVMAIPAATVVAALPAPIGLPEKTEEMTVITSEPQEASDASAETPATITGSRTAVRFSFGSQEVHGSGWKVCFSF